MPGSKIIPPALASRVRSAAIAAGILLVVIALAICARAQKPAPTRPPAKNFSWNSYRIGPDGKQVPQARFGCVVATPLSLHDILMDDFYLTTFRDNLGREPQLTARGPECHLDTAGGIAWDKGPVKIYTPTTNLYTEGVGFYSSQSNQFLIVSNRVETRIVKSMLKTPLFGATNASEGEANGIVRILADYAELHYSSNFLTYSGRVHVIDSQMDITSRKMAVNFTTNGTVSRILWTDEVVVTTTNKGYATGHRALYFVTNGVEYLELSGDAAWQNGAQQAWAELFTYEPERHFLTATNHVRVRFPKTGTNRVVEKAGDGAVAGTPVMTNFMGLSADFATVQSDAQTGQAQIVNAMGNVVITNETDHSHSSSDRAIYNHTNDWVQLIGQPSWQDDQMQVSGWALTVQVSNRTYHAEGQAQLKMRVGASASGPAHSGPARIIWISSSTIDYKTNLAIFTEPVSAKLMEGDRILDTLTCKGLTLGIGPGNQVETAIARGDVHGETVPATNESKKIILCQTLTVQRSPQTLRLQRINAEENASIEVVSTGINSAYNHLTAERMNAVFFPDTNRVQHAEALGNVAFQQSKGDHRTRATGDKAVYQGDPADQVELTGRPWGRTESVIISNAAALTWDLKSSAFGATGLFNIIPLANKSTNGPKMTSRFP